MEGSSSPRYDGVVSSPRNGVTVAWPEHRGGTRAESPARPTDTHDARFRRRRPPGRDLASAERGVRGEGDPRARRGGGRHRASFVQQAPRAFRPRRGRRVRRARADARYVSVRAPDRPQRPGRPDRASGAVPSPKRAVSGLDRARPERVLPVLFFSLVSFFSSRHPRPDPGGV